MRTGLFLLIIITAAATATAQKAYWVTESNNNVKGVTIVKVYDFSNEVITEKRIERQIDITDKREQRMLDRIVRNAVRERAALARKSRKSTGEIQTARNGMG